MSDIFDIQLLFFIIIQTSSLFLPEIQKQNFGVHFSKLMEGLLIFSLIVNCNKKLFSSYHFLYILSIFRSEITNSFI